MEYITSKSNEKVKYIKSLNDKKYRKKYGAYYLEGIKVVSEALDIYENGAIDIEFIAYSYDILNNLNGSDKLLKKIMNLKKIQIINIKEEIFKSMTETVTTQGVLVVIKLRKEDIKNVSYNDNILLLDGLKDQGNIGTLIRTADAFGIKNIICTNNTADIYSQKVLRSTMSSILRVNIFEIDIDDFKVNLNQFKKHGYSLIGSILNTENNLKNFNFSKKSIFVLGNEANGISSEISKLCDEYIKIQMESTAESLNVAIAGGIILYEQYINK